MEKNCPKCGGLMKLIPAGKSKKPPYREYDAFYSCDSRNGGCGNTEKIVSPATQGKMPEQHQSKVAEYLEKLFVKLDEVAKKLDVIESKIDNLEIVESPLDDGVIPF